MLKCFLQAFIFLICAAGTIAASAQNRVAAGSYHSVAVCSDNSVWVWGQNLTGQLGDGTNNNATLPIKLSGLSDVRSAACGVGHTLFLKNDGTVWSTGKNNLGQLGIGNLTDRNTPQQISALSGIIDIAAGDNHSLFLKNDGTVWACGVNAERQLGIGVGLGPSTPVQVTALSNIIGIAGGGKFSLFLKSDGTVLACGENLEGQLGRGTFSQYEQNLVQVNTITGITAIAAGVSHSLFLKNDGTVWSVGYNVNGQLGDGTTTRRNNPVSINSLTGVIKISAKARNSLFLKSDGTVWGCGSNMYGQIGDGNSGALHAIKSTPIQTSVVSGISFIASGGEFASTPYGHSLFMKNDFTLWSSGLNTSGQLGISTPGVQQPTPQPVVSFCPNFTSLTDFGTTTKIAFFPNPANDMITIGNLSRGSALRITDITGTVIYTAVINGEQAIINTSKFVNGIYILQVSNKSAIRSEKFVVSR